MTPRRGQTIHESHLAGGTSTTLPASPRPATFNTYRRFNATAIQRVCSGSHDAQIVKLADTLDNSSESQLECFDDGWVPGK